MKKLSEFINSLNKLKTDVSFELDLTEESKNKILYQKLQDRDFCKITKQNSNEILKAIASDFVKKDIVSNPTNALLQACEKGGLVYKAIVYSRFGFGQKDIWLKPLSLSYILKKGNAKIGINTGKLHRDIKTSQVIIKEKKK